MRLRLLAVFFEPLRRFLMAPRSGQEKALDGRDGRCVSFKAAGGNGLRA
jgi:hypothetical protein